MSFESHYRRRGSAARRGAEKRLRFERLEDRQLLTISVGSAANDTAEGLLEYGGPGDPSRPGFHNVGVGSAAATSVTYLGGGWAITANHVAINQTGVYFGGVNYKVDLGTVRRLHNLDNSWADLKVFRLYDDPGLPPILLDHLASSSPVGQRVFMIGNGRSRGAQQRYWEVDTSVTPWGWTETTQPDDPGPQSASGFSIASPQRIRWAENTVDSAGQKLAGVQAMVTRFDHVDYTYNPLSSPLPHEGQASTGDSGGALFAFVDGKWVLSGIMIAVTANWSGQPSGTSLFGFQTVSADLSYYRDEILSIAGVVGRQVFYNESWFDGMNAGVDQHDDAAIATDKRPYFAGAGVITPNSMTSYTKGINGLMVDLASHHGPITADDFTFRMSGTLLSANNAAASWQPAPDPAEVVVRPGAGVGGSDRVVITWANGSIADRYLQVIVEGNDAAGGFNRNTGLAYSDVFFFGNKVADTFLETGDSVFVTSATDESQARDNIGAGVAVTNLYDFDRNGFAGTANDQFATRANYGLLWRIDILGGSTAEPPAGEGIASLWEEDGAFVDVGFEEELLVVSGQLSALPRVDDQRDRAFAELGREEIDPRSPPPGQSKLPSVAQVFEAVRGRFALRDQRGGPPARRSAS